MKVHDFMVPKSRVISLPNTAKIHEAGKLMIDNKVSSVVILDDLGAPLGILTKTDLVRSYTEGRPNTHAVSQIMCHDLLYVDEHMERDAVSQLMTSKLVHHVLVKNKKNEYVGLTTSLDVVRESYLDSKAFPYNRSVGVVNHHKTDSSGLL